MLPQAPEARIALKWLFILQLIPLVSAKDARILKTQNMTGALVRNGLNTLCL